jgi:hypothetical protein
MEKNIAGVKIPILKHLVPASGGYYRPRRSVGEGSKNLKLLYLACRLPNHLIRILILPNTKKDRLTKTVIPCPLRGLYLADHHGLNPATPFHFNGG